MSFLKSLFSSSSSANASSAAPSVAPLQKDDAYYRKVLTPLQYAVSRQADTEPPGTGKYVNNHAVGTYGCVSCSSPLFLSSSKFESGTGWPSFFAAMPGAVSERVDDSLWMRRVEAVCSQCNGHLGHVFDDGPRLKGGRRFCINSASLTFVPQQQAGRPQTESELVDHNNSCAT